jgi:hypothetical protein
MENILCHGRDARAPFQCRDRVVHFPAGIVGAAGGHAEGVDGIAVGETAVNGGIEFRLG